MRWASTCASPRRWTAKSPCADSDFVINTAYAKGHHHARRIREATAEHGYYYGGVDLGGFYDLSLIMSVARDMERICPDAWLIQSGNPVFEGCTLMGRETDLKVIGLCHGHYGYLEMCKVLGLDPARVTWQAPGINHEIWLVHFLYDGEDAYPLLDRVDRLPRARNTGVPMCPRARTTSRCRAGRFSSTRCMG